MASWRKSTPSRSAARHQREAGATSNREQASIQAPAGTSAPAAPSRRDSATKWAAWLLVALVAVVYGRTANFDFLSWDDGYHVTQNPWLNPPSTTGLAHLWKQPYFGLYAPVAYTAFAAESLVSGWLPGAADSSGLQPWVFHLGSVMLHAINSLLVYRLLRRMVGQTWPAAAGAALFASHPLQVEAVAWISETRGLLSALFGLLAILIMLPGADLHRLDQSRWRSGLRWGLATACYLAALCSKPTAVVVPALLLVIAWAWPRLYRHDHLDDPAGDASDTALGSVIAGMRRLGWSWIALLLVWTTIGLSFAIGTSHLQHHVALSTSLPWYVRPFAALAGTGFYLGKLCLPVDLAPDYGWRTPVMASPQWRYAWSVVPLLAAALLTLRRRTIDRRWWAVALVTLVAVAPTSGIVSSAFQAISLVADRYFYLAMLGPALGMALWLVRQKPTTQTVARVSRQQRRRHTSEPTPPAQTNWRWPLAWGGLAVCGVLSFVQCGHWSTDVSVASRMLEVNRRSFVALTQRGHAAARNGDPATAAESYRAALHANPNYPLAWFNWGVLHLKQRKWNTAARDFERALELDPTDVMTATNLGRALIEARRYERAVAVLSAAVAREPDCALAQATLADAQLQRRDFAGATQALDAALAAQPELADAWYLRGCLNREQQDLDAAAQAFNQAIEIDPRLAAAHYGLGELAIDRSDWPAAEQAFAAAVECQPGFLQARFQRARALAQQQRLDIAAAEFEALINSHPSYIDPYLGLADVRLQQGRAIDSQSLCEAALALRPGWPPANQALARAQAASLR